MLLGYAVGFESPGWQGIEGYGEVSGLESAALGQLIAFAEHLEQSWRILREPRPAHEWYDVLHAWLEATFLPQTPEEGMTLARCVSALQQWQEATAEAGLVAEPLPLSLVREAWLELIEVPALGQRFFAGAVTFATLMPMRAIPFRHVALLGMNDGDYPRVQPAADFDLMGNDYRPGDRSRREDDRYLFLEALLSARERLTISWVGASALDNAEQPPSVLVGQLRDHIDSVWRLAGDGSQDTSVAQALTTHHPLQPFSPRYVEGREARWFTYAAEWHRDEAPPPALAVLPPLERDEPLGLAEVARWLRRPVEAFWHQRLQANLHLEDPNTVDVEPFGSASGLDGWRLRQELLDLQRRLLDEGAPAASVLEAAAGRVAVMRARGDLPAARLGEMAAAELLDGLETMVHGYADWLARWPHAVPGDFPLVWPAASPKPWLADRLGGLRSAQPWQSGAAAPSQELVRLILLPGRVHGKPQASGAEIARLVPAWIDHLGAQCLDVAPVHTAIVAADARLWWPAMPRAEVDAHWQALREAWEYGMCQPLPLPLRTAVTWLAWRNRLDEAPGLGQGWPPEVLRQLALAYDGGEHGSGDLTHDPHLQRVWPDFARWSKAVDPAAFDAWAQRLLLPLLEARRSGHAAMKEEA